MTSFWRIFSLELIALVRSKTLALLLAASVVWMLAFPHFVKGDGTPDGLRELLVHYSLGGVFALLVVSLLASATGSIARERAANRLQLTLVRPVRFVSVALGKMLAHVAVGAFVLAVACLLLACKVDLLRPCNHVLSPVLPSPREEAKAMYDAYMKAPDTPAAVKRASKSLVMRILTQRAADHYVTIQTNATVFWDFDPEQIPKTPVPLAVRMRFTNQMDLRQDVLGVFRTGAAEGVVSNITQAVVTIPLSGQLAGRRLTFENRGKSALMLRPRKDINLLVAADAFGFNLVRAYCEMIAILALLVAFGVVLSAGLGRPVALFVAFVTLIVGEMSPSVIDQYPDELETKLADRIGLYITRFAADVTSPVSALAPLDALSKDECVELRAVSRLVLVDLVILPIVLALLAACALPRKQGEGREI